MTESQLGLEICHVISAKRYFSFIPIQQLVQVTSTLYRRGKLFEHFIWVVVYVTFKYFAFLSV